MDNLGRPDTDAGTLTMLITIHHHQWNHLAKIHCLINLSPYRWLFFYGTKGCSAPHSRFQPLRPRHQSIMHHSVAFVWQATIKRRNFWPFRLSSVRGSSIHAKLTSLPLHDALPRITPIHITHGHHRNTVQRQPCHVQLTPPICTLGLRHETPHRIHT